MLCALVRTAATAERVVAFSSSWKDRLTAPCDGAEVVDAKVPVRALNLLWHRVGWPPVERFAGAVDIAHSPTPLLIPSRGRQIVTVHDLFFLDHPDATTGEVQRDYAALVGRHARRAAMVVAVSHHVGALVVERLNVDPARVFTCRAGAPAWTPRKAVPAEGPVVFLGTLEPRKNVATLLDAWERLAAGGRPVPELVLAGGSGGAHGAALLDRIGRPPLAGHVRHVGYLEDGAREAFYKQARLLVLPSLDEGFGLPVLEACAAGVPVLASRCGAIPEVGGDAAVYLDPRDADAWASTVETLLASPDRLEGMRARGVARAATFSWTASARALWQAYHGLTDRSAS
jgi:glycosyltransferase involved in cell wall biosynthesis